MSTNPVRYAILSHVIIDDVEHADGSTETGHPGGAGTYAAAGAALLAEPGQVGIVASVGATEWDALAAEFRRLGVSTDSLTSVASPTPRSLLRYFADGEREEIPRHGQDHFNAMTPLPKDISQEWDALQGLYVFHDSDQQFWTDIRSYTSEHPLTVLWEVSADACRPDNWEAVAVILESVDIFSINRSEALALCGTDSLPTAAARLRGTGATVLLRLGENGSMGLRGDETVCVLPAASVVVDPTGGGNSYSGAALVAHIESRGDLEMTVRLASSAASRIISQFGLPDTDEAVGTYVREQAKSVVKTSVDRVLL
jgi:sugar/nucleoside kinase (ribokinase family)